MGFKVSEGFLRFLKASKGFLRLLKVSMSRSFGP